MYGEVFVCVTTLDRGTENEADNPEIDSVLQESSVIRRILGLSLSAMDSSAERRQKMPSAADWPGRPWTASWGPETNQRIMLGPRMRSVYVANKC
jgi:hypothetical protein